MLWLYRSAKDSTVLTFPHETVTIKIDRITPGSCAVTDGVVTKQLSVRQVWEVRPNVFVKLLDVCSTGRVRIGFLASPADVKIQG